MVLLCAWVHNRMRMSMMLLFVLLSAIFIFFLNHKTLDKNTEYTENDILNMQYLRQEVYKQKIANKYHFDKDDRVSNDAVQLCKVPKLSFKMDTDQFAFHRMEPLECVTPMGPDLFYLEDYMLKIKPTVLNNHKLERCEYKAIEWENDEHYRVSDTLERKRPSSFELKIRNEFFYVQCYFNNNSYGFDSHDPLIEGGSQRKLLQSTDLLSHQANWRVPSDMKIGEVVHAGNQRAKKVSDIVKSVQSQSEAHQRQNVVIGQPNVAPRQPAQGQREARVKFKSVLMGRSEIQPEYIGSMGLPDSALIDRHEKRIYHSRKEMIGNGVAPQGVNQHHQQQQQPKQQHYQYPPIIQGVPKQIQGQFRAQGQKILNPAQNAQVPPSGVNLKLQEQLASQRNIQQRQGHHALAAAVKGKRIIKTFAGDSQSVKPNVIQAFAGQKPVAPELNPGPTVSVRTSANLEVPEKGVFLGRRKTEPPEKLRNASAKYQSSKEVPDDNAGEENSKNTVVDESFDNASFSLDDFRMPDFEQVFAQLVPKADVLKRIKELNLADEDKPMNVLIFAMDSMSHLTYQRKMPKTYAYIQKTLNGVVLNGYNIVGDATTAAVIPLTTGHTEMELPEVRKNKLGSTYVDTYPLIWNKFEQRGYVTLFTEDHPEIGVFNLRLNGFEEIPVDHYMRPFYQAVRDMPLKLNSAVYCTGSEQSHRFMLTYLRQLFERYPRKVSKFAFGFLNDLSHDDNNPSEYMDAELVDFLEDLRLRGHLADTLVILMADHGARYSAMRRTTQGKLEERLPMMSLSFPESFRKRHPQLMANLTTNADRLTTPFDLHATLLSVLDPRSLGRPPKKGARGLSLLRAHPLDRTCAEAGVDAHWCTCMGWQQVDPAHWRVLAAAGRLVGKLAAFTEPHRQICVLLKLDAVVDAKIGLPNDKVLQYISSVDKDGRVANMSGTLTSDLFYLQLIVQTVPGNALFEGTVTISNKGTKYQVMPDISRINRYGDQAHCVAIDQPNLNKYCYCRAPAPTRPPRSIRSRVLRKSVHTGH